MSNINEVLLSVVVANTEEKNSGVTNEELMAQINALKAELAAKDITKKAANIVTVQKNKRVGVASPTRKYVLLSKSLANWGKVPQQQADIATLLLNNMAVGVAYTEADVFNALIDGSGDYPSLTGSVQDVTYLFKYYRGLKNDGKHAGFIGRDFIKVID